MDKYLARMKLVNKELTNLKNQSIREAYRWAVKHCTINQKSIERWDKLEKAYENGKKGAGAPTIEAFEEEFLGRKP